MNKDQLVGALILIASIIGIHVYRWIAFLTEWGSHTPTINWVHGRRRPRNPYMDRLHVSHNPAAKSDTMDTGKPG